MRLLKPSWAKFFPRSSRLSDLFLRDIDFGQRRRAPTAKAGFGIVGGQDEPIGGECQKADRKTHLNGGDLAEGVQIPELDGAVIAVGDESSPIRRKSTALERGFVTCQNGQTLPRGGLP